MNLVLEELIVSMYCVTNCVESIKTRGHPAILYGNIPIV